MTRLVVALALGGLASGCYCSHGLEMDAGAAVDAGSDAGPRLTFPDAYRPDTGPPTFDCEATDELALAMALEAASPTIGIVVEGESSGAGVVTAIDGTVARITLEDGREATFGVMDARTLERVYEGQGVSLAREGAWDMLYAGDDTIGIHTATLFQVSLPPFEPSGGGPLATRATFTLDPRCEAPVPECGPAANGAALALVVELAGDPDFYLRPGERAERGGLDDWSVYFAGAVQLDGGDDACPARPGLHAIVEVRFSTVCIC